MNVRRDASAMEVVIAATLSGILVLSLAAWIGIKLFWSRSRLRVRSDAPPPQGPGHTPVSRASLSVRFGRERETLLTAACAEFGLTTEFEGYIVTAEPLLVKELLLSKEHCARRSRWYRASAWFMPGMDGLLNMDGQQWRRHTATLGTALTHNHVATGGYIPLLAAAAREYAQGWLRQGGGGDLLGEARKVHLPLLMEAVFGLRTHDTLQHSHPTGAAPSGLDAGASAEAAAREAEADLAEALGEAMASYGTDVASITTSPLALVCACARMRKQTRVMQRVLQRAIELRRARAAPHTSVLPGTDAVARMANAEWPIHELAAACNHIYGAHKAAGFVLFHALHETGQPDTPNPHTHDSGAIDISDCGGAWWAAIMRAEGARVLKMPSSDVPRPATRADLEAMPATRAFLSECLRRHTVALGSVRRTGAPLVIDGVEICSGTEVVILLHVLHHMPAFWLRPYELRPERWLTHTQLCALLDTHATSQTTGDDGTRRFSVFGKWVLVSPDAPIIGSGVPALAAGSKDADEAVDDAAREGTAFGQHLDLARMVAPARGSPEERAAAALGRQRIRRGPDGTLGVFPLPFTYIPFMAGRRMCAGKALAETELCAGLHAILGVCQIRTQTSYVGHVNGVPMACGAGPACEGVLSRFRAAHSAAPDGRTLEIMPGYAGPVSLLRAENMYSTMDGAVPFTALPWEPTR